MAKLSRNHLTGTMTAAALHDLARPGSHLRLQTIVRLRWIGVVGQLVAVLLVYFLLGFSLPLGWCLLIIAFSAWLNVGLRIAYPASHRLSHRLATVVLAYDTAGLAALLYLTGGLGNPFALLFIAPVVVSAATLPAIHTVGLGLFSVALAVLLIFHHLPLPWDPPGGLRFPRLYDVGVLAGIVCGMGFLALYTARLSKEARLMSEALAATELVLAREQRLHALDGLAAAAAHELGTPLGTIALVTRELERERHRHPHLDEDLALLRQEADRCRDILRKLAGRPGEQDPHHVSLPLTQLVQEAAKPYRRPTVEIVIRSEPDEAVASGLAREPVGERRPGLIFGLGNLIENAVDFARSRVEIEARWNKREVWLTIMDDGPGFTPEILDALGDPYVTSRPATGRGSAGNDQRTGLGLGFFIAKTLLERSGARVTFAVRPAPASGAIVRITWAREDFDLPAAVEGATDRHAAPGAVRSA